jgi:uncharacterized protein (DUF4415 family)
MTDTKSQRRAPPISDAEEAEIQREIASDPDAPEATDEMLAHPTTFGEAMKRGRGRPPLERPKQHVSVRLDADVLTTLKATGPGWQARMNDALRRALGL